MLKVPYYTVFHQGPTALFNMHWPKPICGPELQLSKSRSTELYSDQSVSVPAPLNANELRLSTPTWRALVTVCSAPPLLCCSATPLISLTAFTCRSHLLTISNQASKYAASLHSLFARLSSLSCLTLQHLFPDCLPGIDPTCL